MNLPRIGLAIFIVLMIYLITAIPASAQGYGIPGMDIGTFSVGLGAYKAPGDAVSEDGWYALGRYEMSSFEFEVDFGVGDHSFFLGAADYLYRVPTAEGITQTGFSIGGGITFVSSDPGADDSQFGPNALVQMSFADSYTAQIRYDILGGDSNLWTLSLAYAVN